MTSRATEQSRLPRGAIPTHYEIGLEPDLERALFAGTVSITVDVIDPTETLTFNAAGLDIQTWQLEDPAGQLVRGRLRAVEARQEMDLVFPEPIGPGEAYRLTISYHGKLEDQLRGLYRSTFRGEDGRQHAIATTQFEPSDARRAFPCWDEPDFKATFRLHLVIGAGLTALSNSPEEATEELGGGRRRVTFAPTMRMSTYLVAFVVGPYELSEPTNVGGVAVRIATVPGKSDLTRYGTEVAVHALQFLANYFDIPYPGSKIDHVAVPDFALGAMENFGCIIYRENALLADPRLASQAELKRIASVVAHETAHMWFGDLVTMKWWNGIWLNEAFATFMENITTDAYNRDWDVWASFGTARSAALVTDGLRATRPVEFDVQHPEDAEAMFDVLTYQKGGAVLRMLEQFLGPETFQKGISHYLRTHAYANTDTTDLWDALEEVSGQPVRAMMHSWIHKPGHPLISVEPGNHSTTVELRQSRFLYDGPDGSTDAWSIPVAIRASAGGAVQQVQLLLDRAEATLSLDAPLDWIVVNDGAYGFYRVRYSPALRGRLEAVPPMELLAPTERLALLSDTWAAVTAGIAGLSEWVDTVAWLQDDDPDVWASITASLTHLAVMASPEERPSVDAYIERITEPLWASLGWDASPGEPPRRMSTRGRLLSATLLSRRDAPLKEEARRRFDAFAAGTRTLTPDLVGPAARIFVATGGEAAWAQVADLYRHTTDPQDRQRYLYALAETEEPRLLIRTLDMTLTPEVRSQDAPFVMATAMSHPGSGLTAWEWLKRSWEAVGGHYPSTLLVRALEGIAYIADPGAAANVSDFFAVNAVPSAGLRLTQLLERMEVNVALARRLGGTLARALGPPL